MLLQQLLCGKLLEYSKDALEIETKSQLRTWTTWQRSYTLLSNASQGWLVLLGLLIGPPCVARDY
jgi:hypothetical protein